MSAGTASQWQENILDTAQQLDALNTSRGAKTDAAVTDPTLSGSEIALLKGLLYQLQNGGTSTQYTDGAAAPAHPIGTQIIYNNAGTEQAVSVANPLPVSGSFSPPSVQRVDAQSGDFPAGAFADGAIVTIGTEADAAWSGSGSGTVIAILKKVEALLAATLAVSGTITANAGTNLNTSALALEAGNLATLAGIVSGAKAAIKAASGDFADGALTTLGAKADAKNSATDTTAITAMQILKQLSYMLQNPASTPVTGTFWQSTQPVSAASLPLPSGAAQEAGHLATIDTTLGVTTDGPVTGDAAGSINAHLRGIDKIISDIWDSTNHLLANNIKQVGGTAIDTNSGNKSAGTMRVVMATDQPSLTNPQPSNITQILSAALSPSNPMIVEQNIQNWVRAGNGYSACTGKLATQTNSNLTVGGLSIFNPSNSGKSILIHRILVHVSVAAYAQATMPTTDPAFSNAVTPQNTKVGGAGSVASVTSSANNVSSSVTVTGNLFAEAIVSSSIPTIELLTNGACILLPSGSATGVAVFPLLPTAGNVWVITAEWVEF